MNKEFSFTEKEFNTLQNMIILYKQFEEDLYNHPDPDTLFTETQRNLFNSFDIDL